LQAKFAPDTELKRKIAMTTPLQLALGTQQREAAILVLADGTVFPGYSIGGTGKDKGHSVGEVVFNTAMTGYQEIVTDPSYSKQMVTLTYAHIGNTGTNAQDWESTAVHAAGLIVRDVPDLHSNFRSDDTLLAYLKKHNIVGIAGVDTRKLTRLLSTTGAQNGCILIGTDAATALKYAKSFAGLKGLDLAKVVTVAKQYDWTGQQQSGEWELKPNGQGNGFTTPSAEKHHVVAYDFGAKHNILRMLASRGCKITVVPAQTSAADVLALKPDGVFLSNGPGDPEPCDYAIAATKEFLAKKIPVFGICLGHQILALAAGAKTLKMPFGHHGANHPVKDCDSGRVMITSQNHGFAVDAASLPANVRVTHVSLFDQSIQGIALTNAPAFGFQGHPEASPGPHDVAELFDRFTAMMAASK
jgi:carbamoyl-phosphate synthase small subunit